MTAAQPKPGGHSRAENKDVSPRHYKPGVLEGIKDNIVVDDVGQELKEGNVESAMEILRAKGHTYEREMEARGITREGNRWRNSLDYALSWLYEHRPFYAYLFADVTRRATYEIDTLCVIIINGRVEMWYNPDFMAIHRLRENVGFLQHEMGHIIHEHLAMQKRLAQDVRRDPVFGVAIDLAVDSLIQNDGDQPKWVLMPSMLRIPDDDKPEDEWSNFAERQTWRYYFDLLREMREQHPGQFQKQVVIVVSQRPQSHHGGSGGGSEGKGEGGEGQGEKGEGQGQGGEGQGQGQGQDQGQGQGGIKLPGDRDKLTMDDHRLWDAEGSDSADTQSEVIKHMVKSAYNKAENNPRGGHMRGYMHGSLIDSIKELFKEKSVPFERVFRRFVGSQIKVGRRPTMIKLSRRRKMPPGLTFERGLRILWAQDDSGSVPVEARALCRSELWHANRDDNVTILFQRFTYGLNGPMLNLDNVGFDKVMEQYNGGTDFQDVCDLADRLAVDLLLIGTDGHAPTPRRPRTPVGWILTHDGQDHPWGMTIRMPPVSEIRSGRKAVVERWGQ